MAGNTGRRRVLLLFTVLAGLFLMHGISSPSMHGMPMPMPMPTSMPVSSHMDSAMSASMDAPTTVSGAQPTAGDMQTGETCVPLRPEGLSGLFLALFLVVVTVWRPGLPHPVSLIHPLWPHGPPRTGVQVLRTLSISRT